MKKKLKSIILILVMVPLIFGFLHISQVKAAQLPQTVRIGLFFNSGGSKTAVDSFTISAEKGVEIGWYSSVGFNLIFTNGDGATYRAKKDTKLYYVYSKAIMDKAQAQAKSIEINAKGVNSFIGVNNTANWVVMIGGYADKPSAEADKLNNLDKKIVGYELTLSEISAKRVVIENQAGQSICSFYEDSQNLTIRPNGDNTLKILKLNNKAYRGEIEVVRQEASDMTIINVVDLEQYLYGVVPEEIGASSPPEALKAQAVAARSYAAKNLSKYASLGFNLCSTVNSQVYKGLSSEAASSNKAVLDTKGQVLIYNGKLAEVYYFSSSGGMTEDVKNVWGSTTYPYLVSVEDKYETPTTSNYNWTMSLTKEQIKSKVNKDIGEVTSVEVTKKSAAGRATELVISGTKDKVIYTLANTRTALGLSSQWYNITSGAQITVGTTSNPVTKQPSGLKVMTASGLKDITSQPNVTVVGADGIKKAISSASNQYTFTGKGWGHALGMSQNGAMGMAKAGFNYKEIMEHYFKGAIVE